MSISTEAKSKHVGKNDLQDEHIIGISQVQVQVEGSIKRVHTRLPPMRVASSTEKVSAEIKVDEKPGGIAG